MQDWHGIREPSSGNIRPETMFNEKAVKDEQTKIEAEWDHRATMAQKTLPR
jgi:hypothetical protein